MGGGTGHHPTTGVCWESWAGVNGAHWMIRGITGCRGSRLRGHRVSMELEPLSMGWDICCDSGYVCATYPEYRYICNYMGHYDVVVMTGLARLLWICNDRLV